MSVSALQKWDRMTLKWELVCRPIGSYPGLYEYMEGRGGGGSYRDDFQSR
jgi:hypothetical protein